MPDPVIVGITTADVLRPAQERPTPESDPQLPKITLALDYTAAVARGGGMPVVIPPLERPNDAVLDRIDALVVSGGTDIDPALYGDPPHPKLGPVEYEADPLELALVRAADARGLPILAICRGMQLINVARGGRLWQDLPSERPSTIRHRQRESPGLASHSVEVADDSLLATLTRDASNPVADGFSACGTLPVNSFHHQAIRELGRGLRVTARAPDGVIEAIEAIDRPFLLGVQWHSESMTDDARQAALFAALVAAGRNRPTTGSSAG